MADLDGLRRRGDQRVLLTILGERAHPIDDKTKDALVKEADESSDTLSQALERQMSLNLLLKPLDALC